MLPGGFTITTARTADAQQLTALSVATFLEAFAADNRKEDMEKYIAEAMSEQQLTKELADGDNTFFMAWHEGKPAGYAKLGRKVKEEAEGLDRPIELERIYVLREHYNVKLGAGLMGHCLTYARREGYATIWLGVWQLNHRAVAFYRKWGFEFYGTHDFVLGDDVQTDELMKRAL